MEMDFQRALAYGIVILLALSVLATGQNLSFVASAEAILQSKSIAGTVPLTDPSSQTWNLAPVVQVPLNPQVTTPPMLTGPSIRSLGVRSVNNGTWIAFLVEWADSTRNVTTFKVEDFRDSVAIQFPLVAQQPFVCMGQLGNTVNVLHWKADWQEDIDTFYHDVKDAYPNLQVDYYPFAAGKPPYSLLPVANMSREFVAGWAAGNPLSNPFKLTPVEDLVAGGFGTLTTEDHQDAIGRGVWQNGIWKVVIARPFATGDSDDAQFAQGITKPVAFAVWDGGNRERDGTKSVSSWLTMSVESTTQTPLWALVALAVMGAVTAMSVLLLYKPSLRTKLREKIRLGGAKNNPTK